MGPWNGNGKSWIQGPLEHGKKICSNFKSNEVIKIKSNRKSRNKSEKFSKKESSKIQGVTTAVEALVAVGRGSAWRGRRRAWELLPPTRETRGGGGNGSGRVYGVGVGHPY